MIKERKRKPRRSGPFTRNVPVYFSYQPLHLWEYRASSNTWVDLGNYSSYLNMYPWKVVNGFWNPQWKELRGKVAVNSPYSLDYQEYTVTPCDIYGYRSVMWYDYWGRPVYGTDIHHWTGFPFPSSSVWGTQNQTVNLSSADNRAKLDLADRIRQEYRKFSGGTFMWEFRETLSMIRKPGKALWKGVEKYLTEAPKRVRKISPKAIEARKRVLRETWLEMSYGWQPLLSDIKDIAEAAAEMGLTAERDYNGLRSIRSKRIRVDPIIAKTETARNLDNTNGWSYPYIEVSYRKEEGFVMYTAQCQREILYPRNELQKLVQLSGFSLREWVPTLWNCIPYSFLADYFSNIGDVVEFYATDFSSVRGLTKTTKVKIDSTINNVGSQSVSPAKDYKWTSSELGRLQSSRTLFTRTLVDITTLDVRFEMENPLPSAKKLFNMGILASQFWAAKLSLAR